MGVNWGCPVSINEGQAMAFQSALQSMDASELTEDNFGEWLEKMADQKVLLIDCGEVEVYLAELRDTLPHRYQQVIEQLRPAIGFWWNWGSRA